MEYIIILLLILLNGVFAMYEIALVSSRRTHLEEQAESGKKGARTALKLLDNPQEFLSTIQIGITLVGIISGAYAGVEIADKLTPFIASIPFLASAATFISVAVVIFLVMYLSIVLGELVPKSIALQYPEKITIALTPLMRGFAWLSYPLVKFLSFSTKSILNFLHLKHSPAPPITEEELKLMLKQGSEYGVIEKQESEIITEMFRFGAKTAFSIMTAKVDIRWMDVHDSREKVMEIIKSKGYSKYPVCDGSLDKVIGIVGVKDILPVLNNEPFDLRPLVSAPLFVPESQAASTILEKFREKKIHIAIVVNEFGGTEGLITLHDVIEHILGDLPDILDKEPPDYQRKDDGSYVINGSMNFWEFAELLDLPEIDDEEFEEESRQYSTVGGLAMVMLNSIPRPGDSFVFKNHEFRITEMDGNRVARMTVTPLPEPDQPEIE
ncbi:MAG TPA: hemolysin family protein [Bacteroidales bacterium]|nr:hemolysin family protein [Bacteroidales bacterium]